MIIMMLPQSGSILSKLESTVITTPSILLTNCSARANAKLAGLQSFKIDDSPMPPPSSDGTYVRQGVSAGGCSVQVVNLLFKALLLRPNDCFQAAAEESTQHILKAPQAAMTRVGLPSLVTTIAGVPGIRNKSFLRAHLKMSLCSEAEQDAYHERVSRGFGPRFAFLA
jgi:hypothetical protein